jgi:hypothetical protein
MVADYALRRLDEMANQMFEMTKLCHQYQDQLWTEAKKAQAPAPTVELPPLSKPMTSSKHWDASIDWPLAGERAARLEREDQLRSCFTTIDRIEGRVRELEAQWIAAVDKARDAICDAQERESDEINAVLMILDDYAYPPEANHE